MYNIEHRLILDYFLWEPFVLNMYAGLPESIPSVPGVSESIRGSLVVWGSVRPASPIKRSNQQDGYLMVIFMGEPVTKHQIWSYPTGKNR